MAGLRYREDFDAVRDRMARWWQGEDLGRPALQLTVPRATPRDRVPVLPEPPGWVTHYSTRSFEYRVNLALRACASTDYLAEAVPCVAPDLGPNCLALYLGCRGEERPGTVWFHPCIASPETARFAFDGGNPYWDFTLRLAREQLRLAGDRFLTSYPDLIEGLDTLAAMRGSQALLVDLLERPGWVRASLERITALYFRYYDHLYDLVHDDRGGSHFWAWAPGRMAKLQCDFSAMVSPAMFRDFMVPVLECMAARLDRCMYHWDGPGAIGHLDALLSIDRLDAIQWTPGAGIEPVAHRRWWPLFHRIVDAEKAVVLLGVGLDEVCPLRREFGGRLQRFLIGMRCADLTEARVVMSLVEG